MTRSISTLPARRLFSFLAGMALVAWTAGCGPDQEAQATDQATRRVRERAALSQQAVQNLLMDQTAPRGEELLNVLADLVTGEERHGSVFGRQRGPDDRVQLDVAFDGTGYAGGLAPAEVTVRLCVRVTGVRQPEPNVVMTDTACDPRLDRQLGQPDAVVQLEQ